MSPNQERGRETSSGDDIRISPRTFKNFIRRLNNAAITRHQRQKKISDIRERMESLSRESSEEKPSGEKIQKELDELQGRIEEVIGTENSLVKKLGEEDNEIDRLKEKIAMLEERIEGLSHVHSFVADKHNRRLSELQESLREKEELREKKKSAQNIIQGKTQAGNKGAQAKPEPPAKSSKAGGKSSGKMPMPAKGSSSGKTRSQRLLPKPESSKKSAPRTRKAGPSTASDKATDNGRDTKRPEKSGISGPKKAGKSGRTLPAKKPSAGKAGRTQAGSRGRGLKSGGRQAQPAKKAGKADSGTPKREGRKKAEESTGRKKGRRTGDRKKAEGSTRRREGKEAGDRKGQKAGGSDTSGTKRKVHPKIINSLHKSITEAEKKHKKLEKAGHPKEDLDRLREMIDSHKKKLEKLKR
ncbi:MAG: hypothetical protein R6U32_06740 [Candidatus Woesearchaeota archaeon]